AVATEEPVVRAIVPLAVGLAQQRVPFAGLRYTRPGKPDSARWLGAGGLKSMWRFAAAQATGSSHEKLSLPCQDRMTCAVLEGEDSLIAVVADGAGTAGRGHEGAEVAVWTVSSIA